MADEQAATANALPSKNFFVKMLVRDIELIDALLDLLDNCVDGILRSHSPDQHLPLPYAGYRAEIVLGPEGFSIEDNCGGIPLKIAKEKAFAIGNPEPITGEDAVGTVGMYGIGMKRAIFKMGRNAVVESWNDEAFRVSVTPKWLDDPNWSDLPMKLLGSNQIEKGSTRIAVDELHAQVVNDFLSPSFVQDLRTAISQNYSLIIAKGFEVLVRHEPVEQAGKAIQPEPFKLLLNSKADAEGATLAPFTYRGKIGEVDIEIYAGLYRQLPDEDEREREEDTRGSSEEAGWTLACNDRVVVWKDRTRLTGWGEASTPNYHGQFIAITGIVLLKSSNPNALPLTTTKRGIDAGAPIYSFVKDMMRETTKALTTFTNKWKKFEPELERLYQDSKYVGLDELGKFADAQPMRVWNKLETISRFSPKLPVPRDEKISARVSFLAPKGDVVRLAVVYFDDAKAKAKDVGEEAFRRELTHYSEAAE